MKQAISILLAIFAPLAALPTGWAIYSGAIRQPAFPMNPVIAGIGAGAVVIVSMAASDLLMDIYKFNQKLRNQRERALTMPLWWGWAILGTGLGAEIVLSLLIQVFEETTDWAVLVFPLLTLSGAFAFAVRINLHARMEECEQMRVKPARAEGTVQSQPAEMPAQRKKRAAQVQLYTCAIEGCGMQYRSKAAHMRHQHPELCAQKVYRIPSNAVEEKVQR